MPAKTQSELRLTAANRRPAGLSIATRSPAGAHLDDGLPDTCVAGRIVRAHGNHVLARFETPDLDRKSLPLRIYDPVVGNEVAPFLSVRRKFRAAQRRSAVLGLKLDLGLPPRFRRRHSLAQDAHGGRRVINPEGRADQFRFAS